MSERARHDAASTDRSTDRPNQDAGVNGGQQHAGAEYRHDSSSPSVVMAEGRRRGPGRRGLVELAEQLSPRDLAVLDLIALHRFLTTTQLEGFYFDDHHSNASGSRSCRRVLARLERLDLVERPRRRVGGLLAGSAPSVWMLTSIAVRLRSLLRGSGDAGRVRTPGDRFIAHHLAVADLHLALVNAQRVGRLVLHRLSIEPASWRTYDGTGGQRRVLKPDLLAVISSARDSEYEDHYFVEIDLTTESLPTVLRQCRQYVEYRATGDAQAKDGVFPWVVWVAPPKRAERIQAAIETARSIDSELFKVTTPDRVVDLLTAALPQGTNGKNYLTNGGEHA